MSLAIIRISSSFSINFTFGNLTHAQGGWMLCSEIKHNKLQLMNI